MELVPNLGDLFARSDHVAILLPKSPEVKQLVNREIIGRMQSHAYLYNVGRSWSTDEAALLEALQQGRIAGAGLDVFDDEPLPPDSPFWTLPNVIVTPHIAGDHPGAQRVLRHVFIDNLRRYARGEPLANVVDKTRGYSPH